MVSNLLESRSFLKPSPRLGSEHILDWTNSFNYKEIHPNGLHLAGDLKPGPHSYSMGVLLLHRCDL